VGSIHSPNYPNNYDTNLDCLWLIEVNKNYVIWFAFIDFDMNNYRSNCVNNFVKVSDKLQENFSRVQEISICNSALFTAFRILYENNREKDAS